MRSKAYITTLSAAACVLAAAFFTAQAAAQTFALLSVDGDSFAAGLTDELQTKAEVIDRGLAETAFKAVNVAAPYNMTTAEGMIAGKAIGCDILVLVRARTERRNSFERGEYFESWAAVYVVSARSGQLIDFTLHSADAETANAAAEALTSRIPAAAAKVIAAARSAAANERNNGQIPEMEEPPAVGSPAGKGFTPPAPYKRIKPQTTQLAYLYDIAATVDAEVDLDAGGNVLKVRIKRWAGFGLDEAVSAAIVEMNWRPAMRGGKALPMRFLLRYNFKRS